MRATRQVEQFEFLITKTFAYVAVLLIPFYFLRFELVGIPTNIFEIAVLIAIFPMVLELIVHRKQPEPGKLLPFLLVFFAGVSIFIADDTRAALGIFKSWFLVPSILYLVIINSFNRDEVLKLAYPIYISLLIISAWAILQKLGVITTLFYQTGDSSFSQYLSDSARVFGPFESPNYLAMYLVPTIFLSLPIFAGSKFSFTKVFYAIGFTLPVLALWYAGSRAGIIAFLVSIIIFSIIQINKKFNISNILLAALSVLSIAALVYFFIIIQFNPNSDNIRIEIYKYSIDLIQANWSFGVGLGGFKSAIVAITENAESFKTHALPYALHPHNIFMAFWLNLGLAGVLVFVINLVSFFYQTAKDKKKTIIFAATLMAMIAIIIHGFFDTTYFKNDLAAIFWLILALRYLTNDEKTT